jgi:2',3'-cyclic-nucleotide 2'-phosphodiesterase (5'-nucleotidase family)
VLLFYHSPSENAERLIKNYPDIDVVILGHEKRVITAWSIGKTTVVSPGEEGNWLGIFPLLFLLKELSQSRTDSDFSLSRKTRTALL